MLHVVVISVIFVCLNTNDFSPHHSIFTLGLVTSFQMAGKDIPQPCLCFNGMMQFEVILIKSVEILSFN